MSNNKETNESKNSYSKSYLNCLKDFWKFDVDEVDNSEKLCEPSITRKFMGFIIKSFKNDQDHDSLISQDVREPPKKVDLHKNAK